MTIPSQTIADLQAQWHILQDLDRAYAVFALHQAGVSLRRLAKKLNCSDWLLRHLLLAREASPEDLALARAGQISTNALARRSVATRTSWPSMPREALELEIMETGVRNCDTVRSWLAAQILDNAYGIQVTEEARRLLANAEKAGKLPSGRVPARLTTDEIIRKCRPPELETQNAEMISWYASWLAIWSCYVIPDSHARQQALDLGVGIAR